MTAAKDQGPTSSDVERMREAAWKLIQALTKHGHTFHGETFEDIIGPRNKLAALLSERSAARSEHQSAGRDSVVEERFVELKRAQSIIDGLKAYRESLLTCPLEMEPAGRRQIRELCTPPRDDHDRAVLIVLDDIERLIRWIAAPIRSLKQEGGGR
jgi:hypothetical protein